VGSRSRSWRGLGRGREGAGAGGRRFGHFELKYSLARWEFDLKKI
jgi:hypothetical protein